MFSIGAEAPPVVELCALPDRFFFSSPYADLIILASIRNPDRASGAKEIKLFFLFFFYIYFFFLSPSLLVSSLARIKLDSELYYIYSDGY